MIRIDFLLLLISFFPFFLIYTKYTGGRIIFAIMYAGQKSLFSSSDELNVFEMASPTELPDLVIEEPSQDDDFFGEF